jgi:hypothetical protein
MIAHQIEARHAMTIERTWEITDLDGSNRRTVTLAQYKAEVAAARKTALAKFATDCERSGLTDSVIYRRAKAGGF